MMQEKDGMESARPADGAARTLDVLRFEGGALRAIFAPKSVAVIGATEREGRVGRTVLSNLIGSPFGGTVYPVNKRHSQVLGMKAYANVSRVPETIDLAVIVTPAATVPGVVSECVAAGVKGAIIISAGFKEAGEAGVELERRIAATARNSARCCCLAPAGNWSRCSATARLPCRRSTRRW